MQNDKSYLKSGGQFIMTLGFVQKTMGVLDFLHKDRHFAKLRTCEEAFVEGEGYMS